MNKYQYKVQGVDYEVEIEEVEGNIAKVNVNGIPFEVELQQPINAAKHPNIAKVKVDAPKPVATAPVVPALTLIPEAHSPTTSITASKRLISRLPMWLDFMVFASFMLKLFLSV